jgi:8-oxo-dGTP pyrophosphatase MutT (NUDIX family)
MSRALFPVTVHLFFLQDGAVLLSRRFNTGYEDGNYSVVAGHVERGESLTQAAIREAREEAGVGLDAAGLEAVHVMHRRSGGERVDFFLAVRRWAGEITNCEPHKCDDLSWHRLDSLPANVIPYVRHALACVAAGQTFSEFGW